MGLFWKGVSTVDAALLWVVSVIVRRPWSGPVCMLLWVFIGSSDKLSLSWRPPRFS